MRLLILLASLCTSTFAGTEEIFSTMLKLPKATKAIIKRGIKEIPVDLTAKPQIKDYDVLLLEEGVYSTLGDFTAKYVRVIGKGQRKTFITSLPKDSSPIKVNSTEFWDLTMADAQFKVVDVSGLWGVNVEFAGAILVRPSSLDKNPAFAIRAIFSDFEPDDKSLNTVLKVQDPSAATLLAYEDKLDRDESVNLKDRLAFKGLVARGANYLYQTKNIKPQYDLAKYNQLTMQAQAAKSKGHLYVAMLAWAEADRISGHSRFDEVLKAITPLTQNVSQECGCTVEGHGLASQARSEIEEKLHAKVPATSLPGPCKIQTLHVNTAGKGNKEALISSARLQAQLDKAAAFGAREHYFQESVIAHSGGEKLGAAEDEFVVGAPALVPAKQYTLVADVEMPGMKKTYTSDDKSFITENIVDPIAKSFTQRFASKIKAATAKMASADLLAKVDGFIVNALYGGELEKQSNYEDLHEQQFGRKMSASGAMSSAFAY